MNTSFNEAEQKERLISLLRKFEQELKENNEVKKKKFFDWHWFPEEPIELRSVIEMIVFLLIIIGCSFLYYRWNVVPNKEFEIQIEDLSDGVVYDSTRVRVDSVRRVFACDLTYNIPMTRHEEFAEGLSSGNLDITPLYSNDNYSEFLKYTFLNDSLRNCNDWQKNRSCALAILQKYHVYKKDSSESRFWSAKEIVRAKRKAFLDSLNVPQDSCIMAIFTTKASLPFLTESLWHGWKSGNNLKSHHYYSDDRKFHLSDSYFFFDNKTIKCVNEPYTNIKIEQKGFKFSTFQKFFRSFNVFSPFTTGGTMATPPWGRLEDISQAYVNVKLESFTVDSIIFNLNFIGATEFSAMDPMPDKIGMSNIIFNDPVKIYKIKTNGLRFHARFIELENWQQIRVFTVTAIMSAFVLIFVVFAISAYFKIRKKIQQNGGLAKHKYVNWLFVVFTGLLLYLFIYWAVMVFLIDEKLALYHIFNINILVSVTKCNLITIPIVLIILLLFSRKGRTSFVKIINNKYFKEVTIFVSICFFIILLCFALYKVVNVDFDKLMKDRKYSRATKQIYSELFYKNKATKDDVRRLRQALLGSNGPIKESINYVNCVFKDDLMVSYVYNEDSLDLYDLHNNCAYNFMIPYNIRNVYIYDSVVIVNSGANHYFTIKKNKQKYQLFDIGCHKGTVIGLSYDKNAIVFYEYDKITYKKMLDGTNYQQLCLNNELKLINLKKVAGDYIIAEKLDSFFIYKMNDSLKFDFCYKSKSQYIDKYEKDVKFLNLDKQLLLYKNNDIDYIVDLTPNANYIDSLPMHYLKTEIKPSHLWNRNTINILKRASAENNIYYMGLDHSNIYLYNFRDTCIEAYNSGGNVIKKLNLKPYRDQEVAAPVLYSNSDGTFFVQMHSDSIFKLNMDGLVETIPVNRLADNVYYINDYIIEEDNDKIIVRPFENPSDSFVVMNKNNFSGYYGIPQDDIDIINGWLLHKGYNCYYIENIRSTNSLILNSKYLTKGQKNKLIGIIKKEEDCN